MALEVGASEKKVRNKRIDNTDSDKIVITRDKLYYKLDKHYKKMGHRYDWVGALALTITLVLTLLTSNFKSIFGIDPNIIKGVFIAFTFVSLCYTIYTICRVISSRKHTIDYIIDDIFTPE